MQKLLTALTGLNLILLGTQLSGVASAGPQKGDEVLRGRGLEIVDARGRVRASLNILPASKSASETVLLRLINADGQPSVKIGAGAESAGLSFVGGDDASYIILAAEGAQARLKMVEPHGRVFERRP